MTAEERHKYCLERARSVFQREAEAIREVGSGLDDSFVRSVEWILKAIVRPEDRSGTGLGKVVVTGVGKSGLVARKIASTFNSTGTTAFYMNPLDAGHGDLGMVRKEDVVILVSRSGANEELKVLIPSFRLLGLPVLLITAKADSDLAKVADEVLLIGDGPEACSLNLAPTASVVASIAVGDALALTVFDLRGLKEDDFARFHPAGVLGKRLLLRVRDIMIRGDEVPQVHQNAGIREVLLQIVEKRVGATGVVNDSGVLTGIVTDGDLKRILLRHENVSGLSASDMMTKSPRTISEESLVADALKSMHENPEAVITCLFVTGEGGKPVGLIHIYECLRSGVAE